MYHLLNGFVYTILGVYIFNIEFRNNFMPIFQAKGIFHFAIIVTLLEIWSVGNSSLLEAYAL